MPDSTVQPATSTAPSPEAAKSDAKQGASNLTASQVAQRFLQETPAAPEAVAEQTNAPEAAPEQSAAADTEQTAPDAESQGTEPAETETAGQEPKEEADDVLSQKSSLDQKTKERIQRRIDKEVGKRKALEARIAELEGKLTQPAEQTPKEEARVVPLPEGAPPLANIESPDGLTKLQKEAKEAIRWAEEMLDHEGIDNGVQVGDRIFTKADLKTIVRQAKVTLEDHIPARAQFLIERAKAQQAAQAKFPFLKDKTSEEYTMAQAIYKDMPWLKNVPQADWIVGLGVKGWKALQAEEASASKPKEAKPKVEPPKPPSSQTAVSASATTRPTAGTTPRIASPGEHFKAKGGVTGSELAAYLAQKEIASRNSR